MNLNKRVGRNFSVKTPHNTHKRRFSQMSTGKWIARLKMDKDSQPEGDTPTQINTSHLLSSLGLFVN